MQLEEVDLSTKSVRIGALNVIQGIAGASIEDLKTSIVSTLGATQSLSGTMKAFIAKMLDDGMISPDEKKQLRRELSLIQTEYPIVRADALAAGVPEASEVIVAFEASYAGLYGYLYTQLKVFDDMSAFTVVADTAEFDGMFNDYYTARDALRKATTDGLLLTVLQTAQEEIEEANQRIDDVRNGDIVDGAIDRSMIESGVIDEIAQVSTTLFPNGLDRQGVIESITPRVALTEDMADYLLSLIGEQEELVEVRANEIKLVSARADEASSRIASIEIDFESIVQIVAELMPLENGQIANLTQITQNAEAIDLLATTGRYDSGTGTVDSFSLAQMKLLADRFTLFVGGAGSDFDAAEWIVRQDEISALVQNTIENDDELIANISQLVQGAESVQFQVAQLRTETIERIDDALAIAQGGMLITATEIQLGVQDLEEELQSLIVMQADRIDAVVQDIAKASASILSLKSEDISALVRGGGAEAYLSLSVTLPATIDATARNLMIQSVGADAVNAVYVLTNGGFWYVNPEASIVAQKTLKNGLRAAGLLGSQIALDADEILMGGKVRAENIDVDDLAADEAFIISLASSSIFTNSLVAGKVKVDTDIGLETDFEVLIDSVNRFIMRQGGIDLMKVTTSGLQLSGSGSFSGAVTASSFESKELLVSNIAPGSNILKKHAGIYPVSTTAGLTKTYVNIQICAAGMVHVKFDLAISFSFPVDVNYSSYTFTMYVKRLKNSIPASITAWSRYVVPTLAANNTTEYTTCEFDTSISEGDSILFSSGLLIVSYMGPGRAIAVNTEFYRYHMSNIEISIASRPGILSWLGNITLDSNYILIDR